MTEAPGNREIQMASWPAGYEMVEKWPRLPQGWKLLECAGVAVDVKDNVYVLTRGEHPIIVFDRQGNFLHSFGAGLLSKRPHGIFAVPDGSILCTDDSAHAVFRFSAEGKLLMTIGTPGIPAPQWSGRPFNRPTHTAVSPRTGNMFVTDGYGNCCVHKFDRAGHHLLSWGEPGVDPGQFIRPHNIAVDEDGTVYVADRENHRVQIFDEDGQFLRMWNNIHRPAGLTLGPEGHIYIGELNGFRGLEGAPGLGHRVSIYRRDGRLVARFGRPEEGEEPGQFIAPHGIAVDSHGDIYVAETSYSILGKRLNPPREMRSLQKLRRIK